MRAPQQRGESPDNPGRATNHDSADAQATRRGPAGSLFGNAVPWDSRPSANTNASPAVRAPSSKPTKPHGGHQRLESPLGKDAGHAGAKAGAALKRSTMRPGGVAEQGFGGTARPLPYQAEMEQSFGTDFSDVKVYTDGNAKQAAHNLGAKAYVVGDKIAFDTAMPDRSVVAHELTHVLQHSNRGGARPASGETDSRGLDMAGEHEAERVESAVSGGKRASSALVGAAPSSGGAPRRKLGPARKAEGGGFSHGFAFSSDSFELGCTYDLWKCPRFEVATGMPPVVAYMEPGVSIDYVPAGVNWDDAKESEQGATVSAHVTGTLAVGLGLPDIAANIAELYGALAVTISGGFSYSHSKDSWSLIGDMKIASDFSIGVKVAGGILDYKFNFGHLDLASLASIRWDNGNFTAGTFTWGPDVQKAFSNISAAVEQGRHIIGAGITLATDGVQQVSRAMGAADEWTNDAYDKAIGGVGALLGEAADLAGDAAGKVGNVIRKVHLP